MFGHYAPLVNISKLMTEPVLLVAISEIGSDGELKLCLVVRLFLDELAGHVKPLQCKNAMERLP